MLGKEELDLLWKELDCFPALYRAYQQALRNARQMDYDDQMVYALRILRQVPEILHEFQARYHYFCVDEAQDTSRIQHAIVSLLAGAGGNLFLVGDEDQSIYGFRAACPDMLLHFEADHPGAKVLFLEQNYRSTPQIVEAADRFIRQNVSRRDKHMQPIRTGGAAIRQIPLNRRDRQYTYLLEVARDLPRLRPAAHRSSGAKRCSLPRPPDGLRLLLQPDRAGHHGYYPLCAVPMGRRAVPPHLLQILCRDPEGRG